MTSSACYAIFGNIWSLQNYFQLNKGFGFQFHSQTDKINKMKIEIGRATEILSQNLF